MKSKCQKYSLITWGYIIQYYLVWYENLIILCKKLNQIWSSTQFSIRFKVDPVHLRLFQLSFAIHFTWKLFPIYQKLTSVGHNCKNRTQLKLIVLTVTNYFFSWSSDSSKRDYHRRMTHRLWLGMFTWSMIFLVYITKRCLMWRHSTTRSMRPQKSRDQLGESILYDFFDKISENLMFLSGTWRLIKIFYIITILSI